VKRGAAGNDSRPLFSFLFRVILRSPRAAADASDYSKAARAEVGRALCGARMIGMFVCVLCALGVSVVSLLPMPTYVYQVITEDGSEGEIFEVVQKMSEEPLTEHPETGEPVRRIPQAPHIAGDWSDAATKQKLSNKNLDRLGFTKYERAGDGHFEKKAGQGPDVISAND